MNTNTLSSIAGDHPTRNTGILNSLFLTDLIYNL
jgi:hypothetical protein